MSEPKPARPSQVTLAGWLVVAGSVVVVLMAFSEVAGLRSLETRDAVEEYLSRPPGEALGLGVQDVLSVLQVALMVAAASAAASAILGWRALQRSKPARLALSVLAVPLLVTGLFFTGITGGGVVPAMVTAAIVMLWLQPARDWFEGVTRTTPQRQTPAARRRPQGSPAHTPPRPTPEQPQRGAGEDRSGDQAPTAPPLHPTPYASGPAPTGPAGPSAAPDPWLGGRGAAARPVAVTWACVLSWLASGALFGLMGLVLLVVLASPDEFLAELHRQNPELAEQGLSDGEVTDLIYAGVALLMPWALVVAVLAFLVWRRKRWAAVALMVSAGVAGLFCVLSLVGALALPLLVPLVVCAATVALLLRPESQAWLRS